jgi:hypothetical protein
VSQIALSLNFTVPHSRKTENYRHFQVWFTHNKANKSEQPNPNNYETQKFQIHQTSQTIQHSNKSAPNIPTTTN